MNCLCRWTVAAAILLALLVEAAASAAATCERLASVAFPSTKITLAQTVAAGAFVSPKPFAGPGVAPPPPSFSDLPAFCRVAAEIHPANTSDIRFEVWMPITGWNGKFAGVGNGAYAGEIRYFWMTEPLSRGYATANTDTGHQGAPNDASAALRNADTQIDFGYRAVHEMTVTAKAIIAAYYGRRPARSYWTGCSTGGRQALMEAQRFPEDYDGIIAGAPANNTTHSQAQQIWIAQALQRDGGAAFLPPQKLAALHNAVIQACDALDGVRDGVLEDPTHCMFDPNVLACKGADGPECLTSSQVIAVQSIYSAVTNPRTKQQIFPGLMPGSELEWSVGVGPVRQQPLFLGPIFKYMTFRNQDWDFGTFDFDEDVALTDKVASPILDAVKSDLRAFFSHGGTLLQYHGWADPGISPLNSVNYFQSVLKTVGARNAAEKYRLFMIPGMAHCSGGDGPDQIDMLAALEEWREKGRAPDRIVASRVRNGKVDRTRPLCPYPEVAIYKRTGSTDDATNFVCRVP